MDLHYKVRTDKSMEVAVASLEASLKKHQFSVLVKLDFRATLQSKGVDFDQDFILLEVCNPQKAKEVLEKDLEMAYFLPCKIGIYKLEDQVLIGMPLPTKLIGLSGDPDLLIVAEDVERTLMAAIEEAK